MYPSSTSRLALIGAMPQRLHVADRPHFFELYRITEIESGKRRFVAGAWLGNSPLSPGSPQSAAGHRQASCSSSSKVFIAATDQAIASAGVRLKISPESAWPGTGLRATPVPCDGGGTSL